MENPLLDSDGAPPTNSLSRPMLSAFVSAQLRVQIYENTKTRDGINDKSYERLVSMTLRLSEQEIVRFVFLAGESSSHQGVQGMKPRVQTTGSTVRWITLKRLVVVWLAIVARRPVHTI